MKLGTGKILEIRQAYGGSNLAKIHLAGIPIPVPGQYLQVHHPSDDSCAAGVSLYLGGLPDTEAPSEYFTTARPLPPHWVPGDLLQVRGPLGKGFQIPEKARRLALIAFSDLSDHLLPLAAALLARGGEVAMFIKSDPDSLPPRLPARIEVSKLAQISDGLKWADYAACSVELEEFSSACGVLSQFSPFGCPCQILVFSQLPCAGLADCGICAVRITSGETKLVCKDGPVLEL
ncbi:MAG: hypothetical protein JW757_08225 [Anaerolineales bacterium]|nr:hypothetical protein [Anaerolineales bacterium]